MVTIVGEDYPDEVIQRISDAGIDVSAITRIADSAAAGGGARLPSAGVLDTGGEDQVGGAGHDRLGPKGNGLLRGTALSVDGGAGDSLVVAGGEPRQATDVAGLATDGVDATDDDVVERSGVVAEGRLRSDGVFVADTLLAKHDERYMPR